jgi:type IV secretion system protein VirB9
MLRNLFSALAVIFVYLFSSLPATAGNNPLITDSRIKTYVYSANEVFRVVLQSGYQTIIKFGDGEKVTSLSFGENYAWQVRLGDKEDEIVIKPLEDNVHTNMSVTTTERDYIFELQSKALSYTVDEELAYVIRFFYPGEGMDQVNPILSKSSEAQGRKLNLTGVKQNNFNFSISGPEEISPVKVFDDGNNTYFVFENLTYIPDIYLEEDGEEKLQWRSRGEYVFVNTVAPRLKLKMGEQVVFVYNEKLANNGE